jgi:hypothetical protein
MATTPQSTRLDENLLTVEDRLAAARPGYPTYFLGLKNLTNNFTHRTGTGWRARALERA